MRRKKEVTYQEEVAHNRKMVSELLRKIRPDVWVLMDLMDKTNINPMIIFKFIRQINNIILGTRWGEVMVVICDGVAKHIKGQEIDKIEEPVQVANKKLDRF